MRRRPGYLLDLDPDARVPALELGDELRDDLPFAAHGPEFRRSLFWPSRRAAMDCILQCCERSPSALSRRGALSRHPCRDKLYLSRRCKMKWEVIPEIFFDLVARVLPGSLVLLAALLLSEGPAEGGRNLVTYTSDATFASGLVFALLAYFTALILKQVWDVVEPRVKKKSKGTPDGNPLYKIYCDIKAKDQPARVELPDIRIVLSCIRHSLPDEGLRLLKIQAEKNFCEVMLAGFPALLLLGSWQLFREPNLGQAWLLLTLLVSGLSFHSWRAGLEDIFRHDLCALWRLLEIAGKDFVINPKKEG